MRTLPGLIVLGLGFCWIPAFGEEIPAGPPPVSETVKPEEAAVSADEGYVDRSHAYLDRKFNDTITWFDGLFGGTAESDTAKAENNLKWSNELRAEKGKGLKFRTSIRVHLRLPKLQKMFKLVIFEENREEAVAPIPSDPGTPAVNTPTTANSFRAVNSELRYYAHDSKAGYVFLAAGTRFVWLPETFARARFLWRRPVADNTFISPSVTPFWQDRVGFGVTPQLDFGHPFPGNYVFLWANSATVFQKKPGFTWGSEVSLTRILSPRSAIALALGANGVTRPSGAANNYRAIVKYRRSFYKPWLFLELAPETNWRRDDAAGRKLIPAFTVRLELNSLGPRALVPVPKIVEEQLPIPQHVD